VPYDDSLMSPRGCKIALFSASGIAYLHTTALVYGYCVEGAAQIERDNDLW